MSRTSVAQIRNTFALVAERASDTGVDVSDWMLKEGSSTYGNTWGIVKRDPETGGQTTIIVFGFTREEAYKGLSAMATAFYLITASPV